MQQPHNKLVEIILEITDCCGENCSYCGSKDTLNKTDINKEKLADLIDKIAAYPPEQIDISGGNPLLVSHGVHEYLTQTLQAKGVECKIIVNPFNIKKDSDWDTLDKYDWVGVSVNNKREAERFVKEWKDKSCCTMVTNFNVGNIFLFKYLEAICIEHDLTWQIQFTMFKDENVLAVYENEDALKFLYDQINESKAKIVLADNMQPTTGCFAGKHSLGILANGDIIPCLSMRSWDDNTKVIGNIHEESLKDIWVRRFAEFRCSEFKCCKDHCGITEKVALVKKDEPVVTTNAENGITKWISGLETKPFYEPMVLMYGLRVDPSPYDLGGVYAYAVIKNNGYDGN